MADPPTQDAAATPSMDALEGQQIKGPDGSIYTVKGGQLLDAQGNVHVPQAPSFTEDVKNTTGPSLYKGLVDIGTSPVSMADLALQGAGAGGGFAAQHIPFTSQQTADTMSNKITQATQAGREAIKPYLPSSLLAEEEKYSPWIGAQAQTEPGRYWQTGMEMAPSIPLTAATMGGGLLPAAARTAGSAVGSETAGYLTNDNPYARMIGALGGFAGVPTKGLPANTPAGAMAGRVQDAGVPVSAAELSGSRVKASLEGGPPDRAAQTSDVMLNKGGVNRPAGNTAPVSQLVYQRGRELGQRADQLEATTAMPVGSTLVNDLGKIANDYAATRTGAGGTATTLINPAVQNAYDDFTSLAGQSGQLNGGQYRALQQSWTDSGVPELKKMADRLSQDMDRYNPGTWEPWRKDYADYKGLQAGSDAAGGAGTTVGIEPGPVNRTIQKPTDLKRFAEAVEGLNKSYPEPYDFSKVTKPLTAAAAYMAGSHIGGPTVGEVGALAPGLGYSDFLPALLHGAARSRIGQGMLNMNPKAAAAALMANEPAVSGPRNPTNANQ